MKSAFLIAAVLFVVPMGCGKKKATVTSNPPATATPKGAEAPEVATGLPGPKTSPKTLARVNFEFDQITLRPDAKRILADDAQILRDNPDVKIRIEGHADEQGSTQYNIGLSERRAEAVLRYLVDLGIAGSRLSTVALGEEKPIDLSHGVAAWSQNRRAELVVVGGGDQVAGSAR